ncbi:MAG: ATP-binding protein [Dehalococcoidia bacterium]|nr:ATP-binding protein [Dehalococcoidia bacterium]
MTREELLELISDIQRRQSELDGVEVKSALKGTPKRLFEPLSALANRPGGGVLLFGLDEEKGFQALGVGSAHKLLEEIADLASSGMEPPLRVECTLEDVGGGTVVAIEVPETPVEQKPCHYKTAGLQRGSFIRVGNTNRQMTDYEIFGYVSARTQPVFDESPIAEANLDELDQEKLDSYLVGLRREHPQSNYLHLSDDQVLNQLRIVRDFNGTLHPTLAGLLMFGKNPQVFEPQLVITFLQFYGTSETEEGPRGERFLDNRKFEGTIPEVVGNAVNHVLATIRKSSLIEGLWRRDIPEYPAEAVREVIINAVAHRDYSPFVRGSYVQIRLFADRLEIQSPGGLYGNVTEETIEEEQSTRNRFLMRLMEDMKLVENRGSGVRAMISSMRSANLEPPLFQDKRSSFWVTFHNHTLMTPEAVGWLSQFACHPLTDAQRLSLLYLRHHGQIANSAYQRLAHVDSVVANRELRGLVQSGLVEQHSTRRWAYYTFPLSPELKVPLQPHVQPYVEEETILDYVRKHGTISNSECRDLLKVGVQRASHLLKRLYSRGFLAREGKRRWARYRLP